MTEKSMVGVTALLPDATPRVSPWVKHAFWGGVAGLFVGLAAAFVLAVLDGQAQGMSAASCFAYGCAVALLLSHPAGIGGMLAGASLGTISGGIACWLRGAHGTRH